MVSEAKDPENLDFSGIVKHIQLVPSHIGCMYQYQECCVESGYQPTNCEQVNCECSCIWIYAKIEKLC